MWQPCDNPWLTVFHGSPKINSLGGVEGDEHQGDDDDAGHEDDGHGYQMNTNQSSIHSFILEKIMSGDTGDNRVRFVHGWGLVN